MPLHYPRSWLAVIREYVICEYGEERHIEPGRNKDQCILPNVLPQSKLQWKGCSLVCVGSYLDLTLDVLIFHPAVSCCHSECILSSLLNSKVVRRCRADPLEVVPNLPN
jgi:hypothetical protein